MAFHKISKKNVKKKSVDNLFASKYSLFMLFPIHSAKESTLEAHIAIAAAGGRGQREEERKTKKLSS